MLWSKLPLSPSRTGDTAKQKSGNASVTVAHPGFHTNGRIGVRRKQRRREREMEMEDVEI